MSGPDGHLAAPSERELFRRLQTLDEMLRASEAAEERFRRAAAAREQERRRIPPVPDLRFEYSYTRSVAPYVHLERPAGDKGKEKAVADSSVDQSVSVPVEKPLAPSVSPQDSEQSAIKEVVPEEPVTESRDSEETADEVFTEVEAYPEIKTPGAIQLEVEAQDEEMRFAEIPPSSQDLEPPEASTSTQGTGLASEIPLGNLLLSCDMPELKDQLADSHPLAPPVTPPPSHPPLSASSQQVELILSQPASTIEHVASIPSVVEVPQAKSPATPPPSSPRPHVSPVSSPPPMGIVYPLLSQPQTPHAMPVQTFCC